MMSHNSLRMYQYFQIFIMHNNKSFIRIATCWLLLLLLLLLLFRGTVQGFLVPTVSRPPIHITTQPLQASSPVQDVSSSSSSSSRRNILEAFGAAVVTSFLPSAGQAASGLDLDAYLYKIVRVREATQQERRLIQTGKFKDRARQNVKLAVRFMIQNYQLSDSVVGASAYLTGNAAQMKAIDVGLSAVQNLQTILEYFDSSDVENIKVRVLCWMNAWMNG